MRQTRRVPTQKRSKEKYELILRTAKQLIGDMGNDSVSMREIAKQSGVPISSIYQYFPDKNAILEEIMLGYFEEIRAGVKYFVNCCQDTEAMKQGITEGIESFYQAFRNEPTLAILWAGLQANPQLKALDAQDSLENAELITNQLCCITTDDNRNEVMNAVLLLIHTAGMAVRLALDMDEQQAQAFIDEYKTLALLRLQAVLQDSCC